MPMGEIVARASAASRKNVCALFMYEYLASRFRQWAHPLLIPTGFQYCVQPTGKCCVYWIRITPFVLQSVVLLGDGMGTAFVCTDSNMTGYTTRIRVYCVYNNAVVQGGGKGVEREPVPIPTAV
jgi:hypothetical protein